MRDTAILPPGSTIGILGGGQLGRMTALAAANLGYKCHIFTPEKESPASQVAFATTIADYSDEAALDQFAKNVDVVTLEFENVPVETLRYLAKKVPVRPNANVLEITQHRVKEKDFANKLGIATAPYAALRSADDLAKAIKGIGYPAILKTARLGYDGKGQIKIDRKTNLNEAWKNCVGNSVKGEDIPAILEGYVPFRLEISVIVARTASGAVAVYPAVENRHKNHILDETIVPAPITPSQSKKAATIARKVANALKLHGLLAIEMFVAKDDEILINEFAPRPHNSGHWTMDGCFTSQFEQLIRAICNLPLGSTEAKGHVRMKNLLGDAVENYAEILSDPHAKLHLYGKAEARAGRKMGHVTRLDRKKS